MYLVKNIKNNTHYLYTDCLNLIDMNILSLTYEVNINNSELIIRLADDKFKTAYTDNIDEWLQQEKMKLL
jgi:hypothetical protein